MPGHIRILVSIPLKISASLFVRYLKRKSALMMLNVCVLWYNIYSKKKIKNKKRGEQQYGTIQ